MATGFGLVGKPGYRDAALNRAPHDTEFACDLATLVVFPCGESHRRLDAVLLYIKARARELAVVLLRSDHEYRGAGHQEAAVTRGVSEDRGGRVNRVFGFSALVLTLMTLP
jgi:hypothetical protein